MRNNFPLFYPLLHHKICQWTRWKRCGGIIGRRVEALMSMDVDPVYLFIEYLQVMTIRLEIYRSETRRSI